jgi:hypothetical protein
MSQFIDNNDLFVEKTISFESHNINLEQVPLSINDAKFGILNLKAISAPFTQEVIDIIFMIDRSGSMTDKCSDGRSKMQHILHTLKNMVNYFRENPSIKVFITIDSFDDTICNFVERCSITDDNYNSIIAKIDKISPRNSTDIELALKSVKKSIDKIKREFPDNNIVNIFMTDGEATAGNVDHTYLANIVDKTITNAFIGFGIKHDTSLLNTISNGDNSAYYFVDKLENSGLVYGEILHGIVYKLIKNIEISLEDGLIYDFKNNIWVSELNIDVIVSESNKIYHLASCRPEDCVVNLTAIRVSDNSEFKISIKMNDFQDLTRYVYRQRTLQYLYIVSDFLKRKNKNNYSQDYFIDTNLFNYSSSILNLLKEEEKVIRENLRKFIEEMKKYMQDNNLIDDKFMKNLCDDIYISYRTFGTRFAEMYNNARQTSQGTQRCYTVSQTPDDTTQVLYGLSNISATQQYDFIIPPVPRLRRYDVFNYSQENEEEKINEEEKADLDNLIELNHIVSDFADTPYLTPSTTQLMREISTPMDRDNNSEKTQEY